MNFHDKGKDIRKLWLRPETRKSNSKNPNKSNKNVAQFYKGIYVLWRDQELDKNGKLQYKIGMAHGSGGIYERLKSYKNWFPYEDEFYLHFCIITPKEEDAKKLEKIILKSDEDETKSKSLKPVKRPGRIHDSKNTEYRIVAKKSALHNALLKALRDNPKLWDYAITFGVEGWKILTNTGADLQNSHVLSKPSNADGAKPLLYSDVKDFIAADIVQDTISTTEIYDVKRKLPVDINTIKKGDIIKDQWGTATVHSVSKKPLEKIKVFNDKYPLPEGYTLFLHLLPILDNN